MSRRKKRDASIPFKRCRTTKHGVRWPLLPVRLKRLLVRQNFFMAHRQRNEMINAVLAHVFCRASHHIVRRINSAYHTEENMHVFHQVSLSGRQHSKTGFIPDKILS